MSENDDGVRVNICPQAGGRAAEAVEVEQR